MVDGVGAGLGGPVGGVRGAGAVAARLARVMGAMGRIPRNGEVRTDRAAYKYMTDADLMDGVRPLLAAEGLALIPAVVSWDRVPEEAAAPGGRGKVWHFVHVHFTVLAEDGELGPILWHGEASDGGDKGLAKALTSAEKTFLCRLLCVSSGDEVEAKRPGGRAGEAPRPPTEEEAEAAKLRRAIEATAKAAGLQDRDVISAAKAVKVPGGAWRGCADPGPLRALAAAVEELATAGREGGGRGARRE
jgi:hypothetical protein